MSMSAKTIAMSLIASTALCCPTSGWANDAQQAPAVVPAIVVPEDDRVVATEEASANDAVLDMIRMQISERYLGDVETEIDDGRLSALLSGAYLSDYDSAGRNPVQFSNGIFQRRDPAPTDTAPSVPPASTPAPAQPEAGFVLTPAAIRAMSSMTRDQIDAIALMVQLAQDPQAAGIVPQASLSSIPSLSDDELEGASAAAMLATLSPEPPREPRVVEVGNGRNLALENWEAILSPNGTVELSNALLPGSRFEVTEGMVVGQFGRVVHVSALPAELFVEFETGDRINGASISLGNGIPSLQGGLEDRSIYGGEILVSEASSGIRERHQGANSDSDLGLASSPRPAPRPHNSGHADPVAAQAGEPAPADLDATIAVRPRARPDGLTGPDSAPRTATLSERKPGRL